MTPKVTLAALFLSAASLAQTPIYLESLSATSGQDVELVLDGKAETGWRPKGDPRDEGILFTFSEPIQVGAIKVVGCAASSSSVAEFRLFIDGHELLTSTWMPVGRKPGAARPPSDEVSVGLPVHSAFLQYRGALRPLCVGEVSFLPQTGSQKLMVLPPREVPGTVSASQTLKPAVAYDVAYLFDGRLDFGWAVPRKGLDQTVSIKLNRPVDLRGLQLWNGYQRSSDHYQKNARLKQIEVQSGGDSVKVGVADVEGRQALTFPKGLSGSDFALKVIEAYPGARYDDLVISELRLVDPNGPLTVKAPGQTGGSAMDLGGVTDHLYRSICSGLRRTAKLRTNSSFVIWDVAAGSATTEVIDGAWSGSEAKGPWSKIQLYGRSHRTTDLNNPYAKIGEPAEQVRVVGGSLEIARAEILGKAASDQLVQDWYKKPQAETVRCLVEGDTDCLGNAPDPSQCEQPGSDFYPKLVAGHAIFVRGPALTDVLITD